VTYRIEPTSPIGRELQRIVATQVSDASQRLDVLAAGPADGVDSAVHEFRKHCKKLRGLGRLVAPTIGPSHRQFDKALRDAARQFAAIRDAQVILPTIELLSPTTSTRDLRHEKAGSAAQAIASLNADDAPIRRARKRIAKAERLASRWEVDDNFGSIETGIATTYRSGRRALRAAIRDTSDEAIRDTSDEAIHEWRKRVKDLWYQLRLLEPIAPSALTPVIAQLDDLGESLGVDHDLAVAAAHLDADGVANARALQRSSRDWTLRVGATLYAEPTPAFVARLERYWALTRRRGPEGEI